MSGTLATESECYGIVPYFAKVSRKKPTKRCFLVRVSFYGNSAASSRQNILYCLVEVSVAAFSVLEIVYFCQRQRGDDNF